MADELEITVRFKYSKNNVEVDRNMAVLKSTVSGNNYNHHVQTVGTSEEAITLGDVTAGGYVFARNLDSTNYVEIRPGTGVADLIRIDAGELAVFRLTDDATAPFAIANTSNCDVEFLILDG